MKVTKKYIDMYQKCGNFISAKETCYLVKWAIVSSIKRNHKIFLDKSTNIRMRRWHCYRKFSTSHRHHHQQPIESVCKVYEVIIVASKHFIIQLEYTHRFVSQRNRQDTYLSFSVYIKRVIVYYCYTTHFSIHIRSCYMHVDIC